MFLEHSFYFLSSLRWMCHPIEIPPPLATYPFLHKKRLLPSSISGENDVKEYTHVRSKKDHYDFLLKENSFQSLING